MNPFIHSAEKSTAKAKIQATIDTELLHRLYELHKGHYLSYAISCATRHYVECLKNPNHDIGIVKEAQEPKPIEEEEKSTNTSMNPPIRFKGRVYRSVSDMPAYLYKEYTEEISKSKDDGVSKNKDDKVSHPIGFDWGDTEMSKKTEPMETNLVDRDEESKRKKAEEKEAKEREHWKNFDWKKYTGDA